MQCDVQPWVLSSKQGLEDSWGITRGLEKQSYVGRMNKLTFFSLEKTEGDRVTTVEYVKGDWEEKRKSSLYP